MRNLIVTIVVLVIAATGIYLLYTNRDSNFPIVTSFEECVSAGHPVMESYPRQCRAGDRTFVEDVQEIEEELITVTSPQANTVITSPITITGEARGNWYFEASFPIEIVDAGGTVLGRGFATAQGEWMTTDFVPFIAEVEFATSTTATGQIILHKDNPSGLPENDDSISLPVAFE